MEINLDMKGVSDEKWDIFHFTIFIKFLELNFWLLKA